MGLSRIVEIDTTGGPAFGTEHFKQYDFLRDKEVVLTFDDGPWPENTPMVLKALTDNCVKATFFEIGEHATWRPDISKMVAAAGMTIGSHTWSHKDLARKPYANDIEQAKQEIEMGVSAVHMAVDGPIAPFFRFPDLQQPADLMTYLGTRNIAIFSTDIDTFDFKMRKPEDVDQIGDDQARQERQGHPADARFPARDGGSDAGTAAPAQGRRLQGRAHGAEAAGDDAREIRRHGAGAGQVLERQQHAAGVERRQDDQRVASFRSRAAAYPESIITIVSEISSASELGAAASVIMDSGLALRAPRNDG